MRRSTNGRGARAKCIAVLSASGLGLCLQCLHGCAQTGPGDTPHADVLDDGQLGQLEGTAISPSQTQVPSTNPQATNGAAGANNAAPDAGNNPIFDGFTGAGGTEFRGSEIVGAGFTGTGGTGFVGPSNNLFGVAGASGTGGTGAAGTTATPTTVLIVQ